MGIHGKKGALMVGLAGCSISVRSGLGSVAHWGSMHHSTTTKINIQLEEEMCRLTDV